MPLPELFQHPVVLLFDSDKGKPAKPDKGRLYQRSIPLQPNNPIKTGIENLFAKTTIERASFHDNALIAQPGPHSPYQPYKVCRNQ